MKRITYYIGLHSPTATNRAEDIIERRTNALDVLASYYDAVTITETLGMWEGIEEPSLRAEVLIDEPNVLDGLPSRTEQAREIARGIARTLDQDAVGLTVEPVTLELISGR